MNVWIARLVVDQLEGVARHFLSGLGGALVVQGLATHSQAADLTGGLIAGIGVLTSVFQKTRAHQELWGVFTAAQAAQAKAEAASIEAALKRRSEDEAQQRLPLDSPPY